MTVQNAIDLLLDKYCGGAHIEPTCDIMTVGFPDAELTGVVCTFMATVDVIRKAAELGANFIITHEPTWFNGTDTTDWCENDSVYLAKKKLLEDLGMTVWRFHDHMHMGAQTDFIYEGLLEALGWRKYLTADEALPWVYEIPATTLKELALFFKEKLGMDVIQTIGRPDCPVSRVGILVGGGTLGLDREVMPMEVMERNHLNVIVGGDIYEWTLCAYINDAQQLGMDRAMITLGHERSEEAGMEYLPRLLQPLLPGIPVHFVSAEEPFIYY